MMHAPLLLLADSQLLFQPAQLQPMRQHFADQPIRAAYVGAANGNLPEFYELACAALNTVFARPVECQSIDSTTDLPSDINLVILAGGNVAAGWQFLNQPAMNAWLQRIYHDSAALIVGVSAGALHLAQGYDPDQSLPEIKRYLNWFPYVVAVHEEKLSWPSHMQWQQDTSGADFVGIPLGGGVWFEHNILIPLGRPFLHACR